MRCRSAHRIRLITVRVTGALGCPCRASRFAVICRPPAGQELPSGLQHVGIFGESLLVLCQRRGFARTPTIGHIERHQFPQQFGMDLRVRPVEINLNIRALSGLPLPLKGVAQLVNVLLAGGRPRALAMLVHVGNSPRQMNSLSGY